MVETGGTSPALLLGALIFLIVLAAAILTGTLLYIVRARAQARTKRTPAPLPAPPAAVPEPAAPPSSGKEVGEPAEPPRVESPGQPGEVMRVIRDQQTGRVLVQVQGQRYEHLRDIADAQVGRRVLWAIADLIRFTGGMATHPQAVHSAAQRAAQEQGIPIPQDLASARDQQAPSQTVAGTAARPGLPESRPPTPPPPTPTSAPLQSAPAAGAAPRYSMLAFFQRGLQPPATSTPLPGSGSFIDEIEGLLQGLIEQRVTPLPYEVHVSVGPEERLQIEVGRQVYGSADEVPDLEVQALIRAAVTEWEKR